jgi:hypothetical protein
MAFKVKDLMISVIPGEAPEPGAPQGDHAQAQDRGWLPCGGGTVFCGGNSHTTRGPVIMCAQGTFLVCPGPSHTIPPTIKTWFCAMSAEQLADVKSQLMQELAEIEEQENAIRERSEPQTVAEIEALEGKIEGALAELAKRKAELKKHK